MKDVCPTPYSSYPCRAVISAWGGWAYDEKRDQMLIMGGGHSDSWYNNIFSFDLSKMTWSRLSEMPGAYGSMYPGHWYDMRVEPCGYYPKTTMSIPLEIIMAGNYIKDQADCFKEPILSQLDLQQPRSAHSYGELYFDSSTDSFCTMASSQFPSAQTATNVISCFNMRTKLWSHVTDRPFQTGGDRWVSAVDADGNMWTLPWMHAYIWRYNSLLNKWTVYGDANGESSGGGDIDRKRHHFYVLHTPYGWWTNTLHRFDIWSWASIGTWGGYGRKSSDVSVTGDAPLLNAVGRESGLVYADFFDRIFVWGNGLDVYSLDPVSSVWLRHEATWDDPWLGQVNGTYGRFRYSPKHNVFVLVNATEQNVFIYKPPIFSGGVLQAGPPPPPIDFSVSPSSINLGSTATIRWDGSGAVSCSGVGGWNGSIALTGSQLIAPTQSTTYTMLCSWSWGTSKKSVTLNVDTHVNTPTPLFKTIASFYLSSPIIETTAPFSLGHAFIQWDVPSGSSIISNIADFQSQVQTRWPDGSVQFAILSGRASLMANKLLQVDIGAGVVTQWINITETDLKNAGTNMLVTFEGIGQVDLANLIGTSSIYDVNKNQYSPGKTTDWVIWPEMSSWIYSSAMGDDPTLRVWFEVRMWKDKQVEILPWIENSALKKPNVSEKKGLIRVSISGEEKFLSKLTVISNTRTPLVARSDLSYWLGEDPKLNFRHDTAYLQKSKLVPTYWAMNTSTDSVLTGLMTLYTPFWQANYSAFMPDPWYHPAIGLLPEWDVAYLTSSADPKALRAITINAYSAGRYGIHFRNEKTNHPPKFSDFPDLWLFSNGEYWIKDFAPSNDYIMSSSGGIPPIWDTPHMPSIGYMAYLLNWTYYFMEESQFAAITQYLKQGPSNRQRSKGILQTNAGTNTTRGVAWWLRSYMQALIVTPDNDPLKSEFSSVLNENILYYYNKYIAIPNNPYGIPAPYSDYTAGDNVYQQSTWMEDFLTAIFGYILDTKTYAWSNASKMNDLFAWKAKSIIERLGLPGVATAYDFRDAARYTLAVAPSDTPDWTSGAGPWYHDWGEIYRATLGMNANTATFNTLRGWNFPIGSSYWGNLQPAIAYAVTLGATGAMDAYNRMIGATNWSQFVTSRNDSPEWSIIPYSLSMTWVTPILQPTLNFSASPANLIWTWKTSVLSWSTANATLCNASNGWIGIQNLSWLTVVAPTITTNYTLLCSWSGGVVSQTVWIVVSSSAISDIIVPSTPDSLSITGTSHTGTFLSWAPSTDNIWVVWYDIFLSWILIGTSVTTNTMISGLMPSTNYSVNVRARDASGNTSSMSTVFVFTTHSAQIIDTTHPTLILSSSISSSTVLTGAVRINLTPSEPLLGLTLSDIQSNLWSLTGFTGPNSSGNYDFMIIPPQNQSGSLLILVPSTRFTDIAWNFNTQPSNTLTWMFSTVVSPPTTNTPITVWNWGWWGGGWSSVWVTQPVNNTSIWAWEHPLKWTIKENDPQQLNQAHRTNSFPTLTITNNIDLDFYIQSISLSTNTKKFPYSITSMLRDELAIEKYSTSKVNKCNTTKILPENILSYLGMDEITTRSLIWMKWYQLTDATSLYDFSLSLSLTRAEAAKFLARIARNLRCSESSIYDVPQFNDVDNFADEWLKESLYDAYRLWIFRGNGTSSFFPWRAITREEFLTALKRTITGNPDSYYNDGRKFSNTEQDALWNKQTANLMRSPQGEISRGLSIKIIRTMIRAVII